MPLETLAGWPQARDPSALQVLGLLIGFPLLTFLIIVVLAKASALAKRGRGTSTRTDDHVWVHGPGDSSTAETGGATALDPGKRTEAGGASARW